MILFALIPLLSLHFLSAVSSSIQKRATCIVTSAGNAGTDDVPAIEAAIKSCGNGGIIVLSAGITYALRSTLDFTGCINCELQIEGTLKMSSDLDFWNGVAAGLSLNKISGATIHSKTGTGLLDGNGVTFWERFNSDSTFARPTLIYITGGSNIIIENLYIKNPPNVFISTKGDATNLIFRGLTMKAVATATVTPKNTDGFDIGASSQVTISNTVVENQDDCVAFKPGCNFVTVTNITCSGSHGLSVGSLAKDNNDVVQNVLVNGATMIDSTKATGIKLYDGSHAVATVSNVTFSNIVVKNCDYAAQIQSCYGTTGTCVASKHNINGVYWKNITGTTSTKEDPVIANMNCPSAGTCNIFFTGFTVKAPSGKANVLCSAVDSALGVTCSGSASG